jgi:hypothetical protein
MKGGGKMPVSESRRRANNKWDAANMTTLGCRMRRDDAEKFKGACYSAGTTPNAVFTAAAADFMEKNANNNQTSGGAENE